jgi:hypothetical protein
MDLRYFEDHKFSQNGEDGITITLCNLLYRGDNNGKYYVEIGTADATECNARIIREQLGWKGLQLDGGYSNQEINLQKEFITRENILDVLEKYKVPKHIHYLSIDIDYNDIYVLKRILENYTCDIVVAEHNATHPPGEDKVVVYDANYTWDWSNYFGASITAFNKLGEDYGYTLVYSESRGVNLFFVRDACLEESKLRFRNQGIPAKIHNYPKYGSGPRGGHPQDPLNRPYVTYSSIS